MTSTKRNQTKTWLVQTAENEHALQRQNLITASAKKEIGFCAANLTPEKVVMCFFLLFIILYHHSH